MRESLYVKDDDWRYSVLFGNYITLTNITETEFDRILRREAFAAVCFRARHRPGFAREA